MGKGVIADLMSLIDHAPQEIGIGLSVFSDDKKSSGHPFLF